MWQTPPAKSKQADPKAERDDVFERLLPVLSVATMVMTVPQVWSVWIGHESGGVSLLSWSAYLVSACLWLVHGVRVHDRKIWLACVGWVLLDAAVVAGVLWQR